jgi:putative tricarboxylic transport membrane protein
MRRFPADRLLGLLAILAGAGLGLASWLIQFNPSQLTLSARFFPGLLAVLLVGLGTILAVRPGPRPLGEVVREIVDRRTLGFAALVLLYFLSFRHLDFRFGTWLFVLGSMWLLGARRPLELALVPLLTALLVWLSFRYGFTVLLPTWGWSDFR